MGLGIAAAIGALVMFRLTHKALGAMWSVSLQLKQDHQLVTNGIYRHFAPPHVHGLLADGARPGAPAFKLGGGAGGHRGVRHVVMRCASGRKSA